MASDLSGEAEAIVRTLLGPPNSALSTDREFRYRARGSLSIDLSNGIWFDHEANEGGGMLDLVRRAIGRDAADAWRWLEANGFTKPQPYPKRDNARPQIVATYDYRDERGALLFQVVRFAPKTFRKRRPESDGWNWSLKGVRRVLYRLPEFLAADHSRPVFLVEGEKDADRLSKLGLVATTVPGGAGKWRDDFGAALAGRHVAILPDADEAGEAHADAVARALASLAAAVAIVQLDGLPRKGDVSDWLEGKGDATKHVELAEAALCDAAGTRTTNAPPTPLLRARPPAAEIPREALGPLRPAVEAIETLTSAPAALAMQSVLGAASLAAQVHADVATLSGSSPFSLLLISVAASGERKSACDDLALRAIRQVERERLRAYPAALETHEVEAALHEVARGAILKDRSEVIEREADLAALGAAPAPPPAPNILLSDPTVEGAIRFFEIGQPSIGIFSDEGGQIFGGHAMNRENRLKSAAVLSKLWDGGAVNRTRASGPSRTFFGRRVAAHLMIQPRIAEAVLGDETLRDQGLLSRALVAWPESRFGLRVGEPTEVEDRYARAALAAYDEQIITLLEKTPPTAKDAPLELDPRRLALTTEARALLRSFADAVEIAIGPEGPLATIAGVAAKAAEQAARLAGVMTIYRDADADEVDGDTMRDAIVLAQWSFEEAHRLLDAGAICEETHDAERLRLWLVGTWKEPFTDVRSIVRFGPGALRDTARVRRLIPMLAKNGWLEPQLVGAVVRGRRVREAWRVARP